jgi:hypothetical protein
MAAEGVRFTLPNRHETFITEACDLLEILIRDVIAHPQTAGGKTMPHLPT